MRSPNQQFVRFIRHGEFDKLPYLDCLATEWTDSPAYSYDGIKMGWQHEPHCHFKYTVEGYGFLSYKGTTYKVDRGKAFIFPKRVSDVCFYYPPKETQPWRFLDCVFCNLDDEVDQLNARHGPIYDLGEGSLVVRKFQSLMNAQKQKDTMISSSESFGACAELIQEMCRIIELKENGETGSLAIKARNLIDQRRMQVFSLPDLSKSLGVCPEHLCREFKKALNETPKHYHDQLRTKLICERLINSELPIKDIATEFGFRSMPNFNAYFKKQSGLTPGHLRRSGHKVIF